MDGSRGGIACTARARAGKPFRIDFDRVANNGRLLRNGAATDRHLQTERVLRVVVGSGRTSMLNGSALPPMVLIPLRGSLRLADGEALQTLRTGQLFVAEGGQCTHVIGSQASLWITVMAPAPLWRQLINSTRETPVPEPVLLPATHPADREIRRAAVQLARDAARAGAGDKVGTATSAIKFVTLLAELQAGFDPLIKRCPGRTLSQRRAVFLRLQRVYNRMESSSELDLGIAEFARAANYSTCHFVRTFNAVFGETPYSVLMEQRLKRAFRLVQNTELSITEVARASGFEDRCAFARSFKRRFGQTASAARGRGGEAIGL
jgi:AraC family transcriptional regulator